MDKRLHEVSLTPLTARDFPKDMKGFTTEIRLYEDRCSLIGCDYNWAFDLPNFDRTRGASLLIFATDTVLEQLDVSILGLYTYTISNPNGVTISDVVTRLQWCVSVLSFGVILILCTGR